MFFFREPYRVLLIFAGYHVVYAGREYAAFNATSISVGQYTNHFRYCTDYRFAQEIVIWPRKNDVLNFSKLAQSTFIYENPLYYRDLNLRGLYFPQYFTVLGEGFIIKEEYVRDSLGMTNQLTISPICFEFSNVLCIY